MSGMMHSIGSAVKWLAWSRYGGVFRCTIEVVEYRSLLMSRFLAASLLLFVSLSAGAQQPRFGEKIDVKLVTIDVIVTGRGGERIHGLTASDFELFEAGKRQEITNFTEYRLPLHDPALPPAGAAPPASAGVPVATDREPGTMLVLVDYLPQGGFLRPKVFESLRALVSRAAADGNKVGIAFWSPGRERVEMFVQPSSDVRAVEQAVDRLDRRVTAGSTESAESSQAGLENSMFDQASDAARSGGRTAIDYGGDKDSTAYFADESDLTRFRRKTSAMQRLVRTLAARPGRKSILYVSTSFGLAVDGTVRLTEIGALDALAKNANAAGVTFYAVQPDVPLPFDSNLSRTFKDVGRSVAAGSGGSNQGQALFASGLEALSHLTRPTGGILDLGLQSVETVGRDLAEDLQSYYSIGYQARSEGGDEERRIVVKPRERAYRLRARKSIVEKSNETLAREMLLTRLFSEEGGNDLHFQIEEKTPRHTGRDRWLLPVTLKIPVQQLQYGLEGMRRVAYVKIFFASAFGIEDPSNTTEATLKVIAGEEDPPGFITYSVELLGDTRGSKLSIGVFDLRSGMVGIRTIDNRGRFH
jgi:VWFA-related protein